MHSLPRIFILCALLFAHTSLNAQTNPNFELRFGTPDPVGTASPEVWLIIDAADPVDGISFGVCAGSGVTVTNIDVGRDITDLLGGAPPAFFSPQLNPDGDDGVTAGLILSFDSPVTIPATTDFRFAEVSCEVNAGSTLDLQWCSTLGSPPVDVVLVANGQGIFPATDSSMEFLDLPLGQFRRGDCDVSGSVTVADVIVLLLAAFPPTGTSFSFPCRDACDANDDSSLGLPDAIAMINSLFGVPAVPLPAPSPGCGVDPSADALDCEEGSFCP